MPNSTVYVDVDLTLIDIEDKLLPGVKEGLKWLSRRYRLICWSAGGGTYAKKVCDAHNIEKYFDYFLDKPDIIIDDNPDLLLKCANVVRIDAKNTWMKLQDNIFHKPTKLPENGGDPWETVLKLSNLS